MNSFQQSKVFFSYRLLLYRLHTMSIARTLRNFRPIFRSPRRTSRRVLFLLLPRMNQLSHLIQQHLILSLNFIQSLLLHPHFICNILISFPRRARVQIASPSRLFQLRLMNLLPLFQPEPLDQLRGNNRSFLH